MPECIICNNKKNFKDKFKILTRCLKCQHIFADLNLNYEDLKKIYSKKYFFGEEYINYINDKYQIEKNSIVKLKFIQKYVKNIHKLNLLEIGCAYGFFLNTIKNQFNKVFGIDINPDGIKYARNELNLNTQKIDFLSLSKNVISQYNVFCMFDVIEHLINPNSVISHINKNAKSGSYLFLTTGDISSLNAKIKGPNWRLIHPPTHIHYFSRKTISSLLEKNGFEVLSIKSCGYYRNLDFILNKIHFIKNYFNFLINILNKLKLLKLDIYLNLYDIMIVVAKKK